MAFILILTAFPALVYSQQYDPDTAVIKEIYSSGKFINYLNNGTDASKAVAKVGVAAFTVITGCAWYFGGWHRSDIKNRLSKFSRAFKGCQQQGCFSGTCVFISPIKTITLK